MKKLFYILTFAISLNCFQQLYAERPKLVVVLVLDQFPHEYLVRFQPYFSGGGFNYLIKNGANFTNARYGHAYTKTAPGHAALITGTYSHLNGMIGNSWYDRERHKTVNCVDDDSVQLLGAKGIGRSPRTLQTYTIGDMLRLHTNFQSNVVGISNKDRSAIIMAGKLGTAYWSDDSVMVTSSYYMPSVPSWLIAWNRSGAFQKYFQQQWSELSPSLAVKLCQGDDEAYKVDKYGLGKTFPHIVSGNDAQRITPSYYSALHTSPFASELLFDAAQQIILTDSLGKHEVTDMVCIGVSATDEIGHFYGPQSREVFDDALRTDRMLAQFFSFLEQHVGLRNCLLVLTSDHGVAPVPEFITANVPHAKAGRVSSKEISRLAESFMNGAFGTTSRESTWVEKVIETDIYLNRKALKEKNVTLQGATQTLKDSLQGCAFVAAVFTMDDIEHVSPGDYFGNRVAKTFFPQRSGDVLLVYKPYFIYSSDTRGTNHGQPYEYDSHVPLIFVGQQFKPGVYREEVSPVDLSPTLAEVLAIPFTPSCEGKPLNEAIK